MPRHPWKPELWKLQLEPWELNLSELPDGGASILDLIAAQHAEGLTVAMVTHDASVAARAQRVVHLRDGQVVEG